MTDRDEIKQPMDHLPPAEERDPTTEIEQPSYPGTDGTAHVGSDVGPETAAESEKPARHGIAKTPPGLG